jgi:hypothetical protein
VREPAPNYASRQYERPNQPWVCGLASDGHACPAGPTAGGACPALAECVPARDGDRWKCNRSALRGGECGEGPTPEGGCGCVHRCRPVRSLRSIRGQFVMACTLFAAGGLFVLLSAEWRDEVISPGPLAQQHAQLLENGAMDPNCAACHAAAERSVAGWSVSLAGFHGDGPAQSQRCMECHKSTISKSLAMTAHNVAPELLQRLTGSGGTSIADKEIACATCHREHQGARFDLTAMSDAACQSCHQQRYESFSTDHPEFGRWPYERRTRIVFNHASHHAKHFAEKKQAFDCRSCHVEDATGTVQLLAGYEASCASCHDEKIATSLVKGAPMIALPTLDVEALKQAGYDIGEWPEDATGDFDGRLPPAMKLLLAGDPPAGNAMATLRPDFDFFDVDPGDDAQLKACADLVAAIKRLLADLDAAGSEAVRARIRAALGREIADAEVDELIVGLSSRTIEEAVKSWLPGVASETEAAANVANPASGGGTTSARTADQSLRFDAAGTWTHDDATLSIRYMPTAHADPVLAGLLELLAATPDLKDRPIALAMFKELSTATAPGLCASCHSTERGENGRLTINWRAYDRTKEPRSLTKFSHGPHVLLPQLADCTSCHAIDSAADTSSSYANDDPHVFVSDFTPVSKHECAQCHKSHGAGESCTKCHNYHVDFIESWRRTSISDLGLRIENLDGRSAIRNRNPQLTKTSNGTRRGHQ